ncbi:Phosphate transport system permease protein PstC 1 [Phycisphaerales bacterium]|nr:Phosphate transport system permease protein PstC 1 [Phycisphaerales bacterium]
MTQAAISPKELSVQAATRLRPIERTIEFGLLLAAIFSVFITAGIVYVLFSEAVPFFRHPDVSVWKFLTDTEWTPLFSVKHFGIMPLVVGTLWTTVIALLVAMPVGTIIAIWLSEFANAKVREIIKPVLELLSAVPTVVYGYFAITVVAPAMQPVYTWLAEAINSVLATVAPGASPIATELPLFNMLSAGIVMGIMIVPYVSSLSEDAMRSVPMLLREGSYGMGANRLTTAVRVVFPAALSGIAASYILAISRAVGETMIVAIAAGQQPNLTANPAEGGATITAYIVQVSMGDLPHGSLEYQTIFAAGITLFFMTLAFNLMGAWLRKRYRQAY